MKQNLKFLSMLAFTSVLLAGCDSSRMSRQQPSVAPSDTSNEAGIYSDKPQPADGAVINRSTGSSTRTTGETSTTTTLKRDTGGSSITDPDRTGSPLRRSNGDGALFDDKSTIDGTTGEALTDTEGGTGSR